jgi:hypothetical protein
MDDLVLVRPDAQRGVLVRDPGQQILGQVTGRVDQGAGVRGHRSGQRLLLGALRLVAAVEGAVQELRMAGEHVPVEVLGDLVDVLADDRKRRFDERSGAVGQLHDDLQVSNGGRVHAERARSPRLPGVGKVWPASDAGASSDASSPLPQATSLRWAGVRRAHELTTRPTSAGGIRRCRSAALAACRVRPHGA